MRIGILITHGTDTLAWSHAFIRYAIKNNHANIILTGSQIPMPSVGEFSDAYENLSSSMRLLCELEPPNILTVFNYGKKAFSDSLTKFHRWDNIAFSGDHVAIMEWDEIKFHDESIEVRDNPEPLDIFYLITTGGTIDSDKNEEGILVPAKNYVGAYLERKFSNYYRNRANREAFVIDSSDMSFERLMLLARKIEECLKETNPKAFADLNFCQDVRIIYTDPFKTLPQYRKECEGVKGVVIAGYGGGNITVDKDSQNNLMPLVQELIEKEIPVVISSQVALGPADFIYENGYRPVKSGAFSGVDLSLPEIQVRLSYLLGHLETITDFARRHKKTTWEILERLFMSGMKFRNKGSRRKYESLRNFSIHSTDLLTNRTIEESLEPLLEEEERK